PVEVAGAVVPFEVGAVLRQLAAVLRHFVEIVAPGVAELRVEAVHVAQAEDGLQCVVVGGAHAFDLIDLTVLRVGREVRTIGHAGVQSSVEGDIRGGSTEKWLVDVENAEQPAALAADVADLEEAVRAKRLLDLKVEVEVVWGAEVAIDG